MIRLDARSRRAAASATVLFTLLPAAAVVLSLASFGATTHAAVRIWSRDSTFVKSVAARRGGTLMLDLRTGAEVVLRGWDESTVRVRGRLDGDDWDETRVTLEGSGDEVRLASIYEGQRDSYSSHHVFEIDVPRSFNLRLHSAGGTVSIADVEGAFRGETGGGGFVLARLSGRASLSTGGGDIEVSDSRLDGTVSTGGGMVRLSRVEGGLRGSSGSGPVIYARGANDRSDRDDRDKRDARDDRDDRDDRRRERDARRTSRSDREDREDREDLEDREERTGDLSDVRVSRSGRIENARSAEGTLRIDRAGGDIDLDAAPHGAWATTGGGRIRIGAGAGLVRASTGGGDIDVGPIAGSVRAGTGAGDVRVTLIDANGEVQDVSVTSGSGHVTLELPANLDATLELETAFTRSFGRQTRIESEWPLERDVTTEWDRSQGTARRYVRANGTFGSGRGRVIVHTVNGDVEVRRGR